MSITKNQIKDIKSLQIKKYRDRLGKFVVEGFKGVQEALASDFDLELILIQGDMSSDERVSTIMKQSQKKGCAVEILKNKEFVSPKGAPSGLSALETSPGILAVVKKKEREFTKGENILVLDSIKDPGNLGTIIRTADWFGVLQIILSHGCVEPYNPKVVQGSMGSIFHVNIVENQDLKVFIKELSGYTIIAATLDGDSSLENTKKPFALIMGNESEGVSKELINLADVKYSISGKGKAESLNVGVATGIILQTLENF